jgi:hypothetical protein
MLNVVGSTPTTVVDETIVPTAEISRKRARMTAEGPVMTQDSNSRMRT